MRLPRRTVQMRLTALYAALFLVSGAGLLTITYVLVAQPPSVPATVSIGKAAGHAAAAQQGAGGGLVMRSGPAACLGVDASGPSGLPTPAEIGECVGYLQAKVATQHDDDLDTLLIGSGMALALMTIAALGLGWLMAGRVLRPLRTITQTTRNISANNLHQRLALAGPQDEMKELGDTVDGLLARLETAFEAQRQFVANASHELRSPLTRQRTLIEVALAEPEPTVGTLRTACERVLAAGEQQDGLIEALLTLARSQRGPDQWEQVDLAAIAADVVAARQAEAAGRGVDVRLACDCGAGAALLAGDARLTERLVANLADNAVRYNVASGWVTVLVSRRHDRAVLEVANSGPVVPPGDVARLFVPFQRLGTTRLAGRTDGHGLGLSIVSAIAAAQGAELRAHARPDGGLVVRLCFPPPPPVAIATAPALAQTGPPEDRSGAQAPPHCGDGRAADATTPVLPGARSAARLAVELDGERDERVRQ